LLSTSPRAGHTYEKLENMNAEQNFFGRLEVELIELSDRGKAIVAQFGDRLVQLRGKRGGRVEEALRDYPLCYWPSFACPVFRGFRFALPARRVLRLLQALQVPVIRVVCFAAPDSAVAARWEKLLGWPRARMTFRHAPNGSSSAAQKWIAIDALFPAEGKNGAVHHKAAKGFSVLMRIAVLIVLLEQRQAKRSQRDEPGDKELDQ
jgi:hypothetical protein